MAAAMVEGLIAKGAYAAPGRSPAWGARDARPRRSSARTGIRLARSLDDLLAGAGTLVVAFKPQHLAGADPRLGPLSAGRLVISVLAGKTLEALCGRFPGARNIVRSMPNTPGQIGAGMTGWCSQRPLAAARPRDPRPGLRRARALDRAARRRRSTPSRRSAGAARPTSSSSPRRCATRPLAAGFDPATAKTLAVETLLGRRAAPRARGRPTPRRSAARSPRRTASRRPGCAGWPTATSGAWSASASLAAKARAEELSA